MIRLLTILCLAWFGCGQNTDESSSPAGERLAVISPEVVFVDITEAAGITFRHENGFSEDRLFPETMSGGGMLWDYDGDGVLDIYFVNGRPLVAGSDAQSHPVNALYKGRGDGNFKAISGAAGAADTGYGNGAIGADFDEDGTSDLLAFYPTTGDIYVALSNGSSFDSPAKWLISFATNSTYQFVGEFDGNGQIDFIAYQDSGVFEVATSLGDSFDDLGTRGNGFTSNSTQMAAGDFDGDCLIDVVGLTVESDPAWLASSWDVFISNGNYLVTDGSWTILTESDFESSGCGSSVTNTFKNTPNRIKAFEEYYPLLIQNNSKRIKRIP